MLFALILFVSTIKSYTKFDLILIKTHAQETICDVARQNQALVADPWSAPGRN